MYNRACWAMVLLLGMLVSSCQGPQGVPGRDGKDGKDGMVNFKIIELEVPQQMWGYTNWNDNNCFLAQFNVPELTKYIYDNGIVKVYREYETGTANASQIELPYVRMKEIIFDWEAQDRYFYTEMVDYEFTAGSLTVYYTASDFDYEYDQKFVPDGMRFRLVLMW